MLKNDPEFLVRILDDYSSGVTHSLGDLAKRNGISARSLFVWMSDKSLVVDYMGKQGITFKEAMGLARTVLKHVVVSQSLEDYVLNGRKVESWHHGRPEFKEDEALVALGEDFVLNVLGYPDLFERDANGNRVIATRVEYAPAQLIEKYAAANLPGTYGDKRELTMKGSVNLGVTTLGTQRPLPPEVQAMMGGGEITETIKLAAPNAETAMGPVTDTPDGEAVAGPEQFEPEQYEPEPAPDGEAATGPLAFDAPPRRPARTPLEQSLFDELDKAKARREQQP